MVRPYSTTKLNGRQKQFKAEAFQPLPELDVFFRQTVEKRPSNRRKLRLLVPPAVKNRQRALALQAMPLPLVADLLALRLFQWQQEVERDVGWLEVIGLGMSNVVHQRTQGAGTGNGGYRLPVSLLGSIQAG